MKISTKGRYALRLMVDLGINSAEGCCPVKDISRRQGISEKYMEQIISALSKAGMVNSVRGAGGGYRLSREPEEYTVGMILRATEGSLAPVTCLTEGEPPCERAESCSTLYVWEKIYRAVNDVVDSITLADLIEREKGENGMKKYTLIGGKLGHSLSPQIHERLFKLRGREASYDLTEVSDDNLVLVMDDLRKLEGFNVTIPHKLRIMNFMSKLDESAELYGAVNCVANRGGELIGYNTDCDGFLESVDAMGAKLSGKVLLIGCGGVGRMIAIASVLRGAELTIQILESDRDIARSVVSEIEKHAPAAKVTLVTAEDAKEEHYDLLVNATPVGMFPKVDACPVSDDIIARSDAVFDVIYNPLETQLIKKAKALGKPAENGMAMLVWQAVSAHRIWDGDEYTREEIRGVIEEVSGLI